MAGGGFWRVLRFGEETGFWVDLPGGGDFNDLIAAEHAAKTYHETSGDRTRLVNQRGAVLWDSDSEHDRHSAARQQRQTNLTQR